MSDKTTNVLEQADELLAAGKLKHAIEVLRINVRENPENRRALNKLGDLYLHSDQPDRAIELFRQVGSEFHEDGLAPQAVAMFKKVVRIDPEQWDAYEVLGDLYKELELPFEAASQYEIAAKAYHRSGDKEGAIRADQGVISQRPQDAAARARLAELYLTTDRIPEALEEYSEIGEVMIAEGEPEQAFRLYSRVLESHFDSDFAHSAIETLQRGSASGVAARLAVLVEQLEKVTHPTTPVLAEPHVDEVEAEPVAESSEEGAPAEEPAEPTPAAEAEVEAKAPASPREAAEDSLEGQETVTEEEEVFEIDLSDLKGVEATGDQAPSAPDTTEAGVEGQPPLAEAAEPDATSELDPDLVELLDDVELDIEQERFDRALRRLTAVRREAGNNRKFLRLWRQVTHPESIDEQVAEAAPRGRLPEPEAAQEPAAEVPVHDLRDLGSEVEGRMMVAAASGDDAESDSIEEIVAGFTQGLAEALSPDDYDTHYNLGLGYQEMGLIDEAIGEFQIAAKSDEHLVNAASMLGYAFRERGLFDLAYEWYERARTSDLATGEQRLAMRYEQAETQFEAEEIERAYQLFQEVYGVDSTFRDVAKRIDELRTS